MSAIATSALDGMPPLVREMLARRLIEPERIAAQIDLGLDDVLLLAGSYATGEANPTSDLDLLVLCERPSYRIPDGASNHPSIFGDSFDIIINGLTVNLEYVPVGRFEDLCAAIDAARGGMAGPMVGNFQALELRLAERASSGVPLVGIQRLAQLRAKLDVDTVRSSAAALDFVLGMSWLEDTQVLASPSRELMLRGAGELLVLAAINAVGPITYGMKHIFSRAARLARRSGAPTVLGDAERVIFTERQHCEDAIDLLLDHAADLDRILRSDPAHSQIAAMLVPFRPGWAWAGRHRF